jgi:hypothetical protein
MSNSFSQGAVSIDAHHHFNPTFMDNESNPWSVQMALAEPDRNGIASAIASLGPDAQTVRTPRASTGLE